MIKWCVVNGAATARVVSENGYIMWISTPFLTDDAAELALHEYLDELGYDGGDNRVQSQEEYITDIPVPFR